MSETKRYVDALKEMQRVMPITSPINFNAPHEEIIKMLKAAIALIEPQDQFSPETDMTIDDVKNMPDKVEEEVILIGNTPQEQLQNATTLKQLKTLVKSADIFSPLVKELGAYDKFEMLHEEMYVIVTATKLDIPAEIVERPVLQINPKFLAACPPLSEEEFNNLEALILKDGEILEPILTWRGFIVDGHNRYTIALRNNLNFVSKEKEFADEDAVVIWIKENAVSQRNLSDFAKFELIKDIEGVLKAEGKKKQGEKEVLLQISKHNTREKLAEMAGMSPAQLAKAQKVDKVADEETKKKLRKGEVKIGTVHSKLKEKKEEELSDTSKLNLAAKELERWVVKHSEELYKPFVDEVTEIAIRMRNNN